MKKKKPLKGVKKAAVNVLAFPMLSAGYIGDEAKKWVRSVYRSYIKALRGGTYSLKEVRWATKRGFLPTQVAKLGITEENYKNTVSAKDYAYLRPLNGIYSKWILDLVSIHTIFKPFRKDMPQCYFQIGRRDGHTQIINLQDRFGPDQMEDIIALLEEKKVLRLKRSASRKSWLLAYDGEHYFFDGKRIGPKNLAKKLRGLGGIVVVCEEVSASRAFVGGKLRLVVFNEQGDNPVIGDAYIRFRKVKTRQEDTVDPDEALFDEEDTLDDKLAGGEQLHAGINNGSAVDENLREKLNWEKGRAIFYNIDKATGRLVLAESCADMQQINPTTMEALPEAIPCWNEIVQTVDRLCRFAPQLEFVGLEIIITEDGFKITRMLNHPSYPQRIPFSPETSAYLMKKKAQKKESYTTGKIISRAFHKLKLQIRSAYCRAFFPKTLLPYLSIRWFQDQRKDFLTNKDTTFKEKLWAVKHGFISYRLHQYGITEENWKNYISDFEYKWLRHINPKYRHWMEDKITIKYVCTDHRECFPEYYYHISLKNGKHKILPMMDCPEGYEGTYEDIFRLVKLKRSLALKPDEGSHGNGFFKFTYDGEKYYLNHQEATEQQVLDILQDEKNQYLITEYIDMHPEIKRIYAGAVNTIRMIVFKKDGKNPQIGNAYMRFGSTRTGAVDNMGAGGMYAQIDVETGRFYGAKIIEDNEIKPCLYHPDTNEKIEGYLPNWEKVKQDVLDVTREIQQLEWFGVDLALTPDGLKFPEINRFPDYPAIEKYSPATIDYLLYKLDLKKKLYGYDKNRGNTLVKLPDRS